MELLQGTVLEVPYTWRQSAIQALVWGPCTPVGHVNLQRLLCDIKQNMLLFQFILGDDGRYNDHRHFMYTLLIPGLQMASTNKRVLKSQPIRQLKIGRTIHLTPAEAIAVNDSFGYRYGPVVGWKDPVQNGRFLDGYRHMHWLRFLLFSRYLSK